MRMASETLTDFRGGFAQLEVDFDVPADYPSEVLAAAEVAAKRPLGNGQSPHIDRTVMHFLTLEPGKQH